MKCLTLFLLITASLSFGQRSDFSDIAFGAADSIASANHGASLNNLPVLTHNLTSPLKTDVEKFRAIYTWVSTNIKNDYSGYIKTRKKRKKLANDQEAYLAWNSDYAPKMFQKMLKDKKTACTGYAYLIRELAELADIECVIVNGYGRTPNIELTKGNPPNHSWNIVKLNNKWYLCDATWSAGRIVLDDAGPRFESSYHDGYFLANPELFIKNHYPLDLDLALLSKPPDFEEFAAGPIVYKEAFVPNIIPIEPKKMHMEAVKNEVITFTLSSTSEIPDQDINIFMVYGKSSTSIQPKISKSQSKISINHAFERSGLYDVHIRVHEEIIATYVIRVKKK